MRECLLRVLRLHRRAAIRGPQPGRVGPEQALAFNARARVCVRAACVRTGRLVRQCQCVCVCVCVCCSVTVGANGLQAAAKLRRPFPIWGRGVPGRSAFWPRAFHLTFCH